MKQLVVLFLKPFLAVITCRDIQHSPDAVAPGLCWADRGGWDVVGGVPVCKIRQYINSCHRYQESIDSISRDERGFPLTQYITNGGISRAGYTLTHFKHHHRVLRLISNRMSV